jgi:hypothetical protein
MSEAEIAAAKKAAAAASSSSSTESKAAKLDFGLGSTPPTIGSSVKDTKWEDLSFKDLTGPDKSAVDLIKSRIGSRLIAPAQREYDMAMARLHPEEAIKKRFIAKQNALKSSLTQIGTIIDLANSEGRSITDIEAIANAAVLSYAGMENITAEITAPAAATQAAWVATKSGLATDAGAGAPGSGVAVGGKGKGKGRKGRK